MYADLLEVTGAWIQVVGTAIAASGETLLVLENDEEDFNGNSLVMIGNAIEAAGNSLQAVARSKMTISNDNDISAILGVWIQAVGNVTNSYASNLILAGYGKDGVRLDVIGDSTQGIGAAIEAYALSESEREYADLAASGASLQSTGSIIEAIGAVYLLNDLTEEGLQIQAFGSYAQLAEITLEAIAFTKETLLQVPGTD